MMRKRLADDIKDIQHSGDAKGILRDPERNHAVFLPRVGRDSGAYTGAFGGGRPNAREPGAVARNLFYGMPLEILNDMKWVREELSEPAPTQ